MTYGFIFSAGKETRFGDSKPKALSVIDGKCLLDMNIDSIKKFCDKVFVIVSASNQSFFNSYETIVIKSGKGCGDAVMKVLQSTNFSKDDTCIISWGDCVIQSNVVEKSIKEFNSCFDIIIPCVFERNPYVSLVETPQGYINVNFKKYGENKEYGYHDFGVFYGNCMNILKYLEIFSKKITINGCYRHKHGNEMQFLDIFNETDICGKLLKVNNITPISFNTQKELQAIKLLKNH